MSAVLEANIDQLKASLRIALRIWELYAKEGAKPPEHWESSQEFRQWAGLQRQCK